MSGNSGENQDGGENREQPAITDYVTYECSVCGRTLDEKESVCHPPRVAQFERRLATGKWLLPSKRSPDRHSSEHPVVGSDGVAFECLYATLHSALGSNSKRVEEYVGKTPYQIPNQPWIAGAYRQNLGTTEDLVTGTLAALRACEVRVERVSNEVTLPEVFAHLIYLEQYGLIPGIHRRGVTGGLREVCSKYYDVSVEDLNSEWVVERRVDRSKVFSTTKNFRQAWDLDLVGDVPDSHPLADYKPFNGTAVLGDHRDHNLVTSRAKQELLGLPYVDWAVAPHLFYLRSEDGFTHGPATNSPPVVGFDFAGFENSPGGQQLRYLGIVSEREEDPFEIYLQVKQMSETHANGIVILYNREAIYDFLHFLKTDEEISGMEPLPDSRDAYNSIPNVRTLHEKVVSQTGLLEGMALMPRRKFLDEGFQTIDELIPVQMYAQSEIL